MMSENGESLELNAQDDLFFGKSKLDQHLKVGLITQQEYDRRLQRLQDRADAEYYAGEYDDG